MDLKGSKTYTNDDLANILKQQHDLIISYIENKFDDLRHEVETKLDDIKYEFEDKLNDIKNKFNTEQNYDNDSLSDYDDRLLTNSIGCQTSDLTYEVD